MENIEQQHGPETKKFLAWYEDQKKNRGLLDVKFVVGDVTGSTVESFFAQVNHMIEAPTVVDDKFF